MKETSSSSLVAQIRDVILATFNVSFEQAQEHAQGLAALAEGWGSESAQQVDWPYTVRKRLGESLRWRSDAERSAFYAKRQQTISSYERYIQQNKRT